MTDYERRTWRLARGLAIDPDAPITARFVDGTLSGSVGPAHYRASYEADGTRLRIGPPTVAASVDDRGYATLLGTVATARTTGDELVLLDDGGTGVLTFNPAPEVDGALAGRWTVSGAPSDERADDGSEDGPGAPAASPAWIEIGEDGAVTGHAGVNRFGGQARTDGDRLYLGPLRTTRMGGPPGAMAAETALTEALGRVTRYRVDGDRVELLDDDGEALVRLRRG